MRKQLVFGVINIVMKLAPIGAFGAMAFTIGRYGIASLGPLAMLIGTFYLTSVIFVVGRARASSPGLPASASSGSWPTSRKRS